MDVQMPELDGLEATRLIRAAEAGTGSHIPIVALTAHAMREDYGRCIEAGMDEYLAKQFNAGDLFAKIEGLLPASAGDHDETPAREEISAQVFDRSALLARVDGDTELRNALMSLFLDDHPRLVTAIERAVALRKGDEIASAAHTLKGRSALCPRTARRTRPAISSNQLAAAIRLI